jgi:D-beta-D-heptose 7-phosphate kinase/D-beta-D-heptose 1-phosphate adenosyltransferase
MNRILLIGDSCTDIFIYGICNRLNPEAPTPVFQEVYRTQNQGMAGNVFNNLKALGLNDLTTFYTHKEEITKTRYVDIKSNYILLRVDNDSIPEPFQNTSSINVTDYDLVIISDYDKGYLSTDDIQTILSHCKLSFIDTKKLIDNWILNASFVKINDAEYSKIQNNSETLKILEKNRKLIITIGDKGTNYDGEIFKPPYHVLVRDIVGAGDTFLASLAGHFLLHKNIKSAISFANLCSGQVVGKKGIEYPDEKLVV